MSVVYFIQYGAGGPIKIGVAGNISRRVAALQTGSPEPLVVLATMPGGKSEEARLHHLLRQDRHRGEWFAPTARVLGAVALAKKGILPDDVGEGRYGGFSHLRNLVGLVRSHIACRGVTRSAFAVQCGLHPNTLLHCERDDWNPSLSTLRAVEEYFLRGTPQADQKATA